MNRSPQRDVSDEVYELLLVEDNPGDVRLLEEAMDDVDINATLHVATDGAEALDFVYRRNDYTDAPFPDIIFLDLDLSRMNGIDILCELNEKEELSRVPVIILTSSDSEDDIRQAYRCNANAYLTKPVDQAEFVELLQAFKKFWLTAAHLPPSE